MPIPTTRADVKCLSSSAVTVSQVQVKMPKSTFKKKKYNARFPPARIKKIMQMDEEVGKVAAAVPVIISRALEMFIESLVTETSKVTHAKSAKTLSTSHIKQTITGTKQFDFLRDLVKNVPDHQTEDNGETSLDKEPSGVKRTKGRPRNVGDARKSRKSTGNQTSTDEEDEDEDNEDTETDEEAAGASASYPPDDESNMLHPPGCKPDVQPNILYPPAFTPNVQQLNIKPNIEHLLHAASSLQHHHNPLQPFVSNNAMSLNNNNNYIPSSAAGSAPMSVIRDSLISGQNAASISHHESLPLSSNCVSPSPLSQVKQPLYQMPSNFVAPPSSHFSPQLSSKVSLYNSSSNPSYIQSPVSQKLSQQQQPIDLSHPMRQNIVKEDDYDT